jgi:flagellar hook-associated protein 1 FlgK
MTLAGIDTATLEYTPENDVYINAAERFELGELVASNLDVIAAALDPGDDIFPGVGDNTNALLIAALQDKIDAVEGTTMEDYFNGLIASLGVQAQATHRLVTNQEMLVSQLKNQREAISGVSLDEEATKIIEFQRMFEGAARVVTVVDGLLDTLINRMGA